MKIKKVTDVKFLCLFLVGMFLLLISDSIADLTTEGLVLNMDAGDNGSSPELFWQPLIGPSNGGVVCGMSGQDKPVPNYTSFGNGYLWYYDFIADSYGRCGQITNLGTDVDFDYDADFTVEVWMYVPEKCPNSDDTGRAILFSSGSISNGYRFGIRHSDPNSWYLEMVMRDGIGDNQTVFRSSTGTHAYDSNWHQVVVTYDGASSAIPSIGFYRDGVSVGASSVTGGSGYDYSDYDDINFLQNGHGSISSSYLTGDYPFDGQITIVRVYDKILNSTEVLGNYNVGMTEVSSIPEYSSVITNGLVLSLDASCPGSTSHDNWEATYGGEFNGGNFYSIGSGEIPVLDSDTHPENSSQYSWFYNFDPVSWLNSGNSEELGDDISFDYDEDFTIEAWIRVHDKCPDSGDNAGRGIIFSDQDGANGYRFGVRHDSVDDKWYLEMVMRDNSGVDTTEKTQFSCLGTVEYSYSESIWYHVAVVYDGQSNSAPSVNFYVDDAVISNGGVVGGVGYSYNDLDFLTDNCGAVGARYSSQWYPFNGDISVVRVYDRVLTSYQVSSNYGVGIESLDDEPIDYKAQYDSLELEMDAAYPGPEPKNLWKAISGFVDGGQVSIVGKGCYPALTGESVVTGYNWYYSFDPIGDLNCGVIENLNSEIDFDYDDDFSIETWVRISGECPEDVGRGIVFSNQDTSANGYRFGVRHDSSEGKWYLETVMRDNTGSDSSEKTTFHCVSSVKYDYSDTQWHHVVVVYDGQLGSAPSIDYYVDGSVIASGSTTGGVGYSYSDLDFLVSGCSSIGSRKIDGSYALKGDVSVLRVYDAKLSSSDVSAKFSDGTTLVEFLPNPNSPITSELVLHLDAAFAGLLPDSNWVPLAGLQTGGDLGSIGTGESPQYSTQVHDVNDLICFYEFNPDDNGDCGNVVDMGTDVDFDYNDDFTIEAWCRVAQKSPETAGRGIILGDQDSLANGYRFGVRHDSGLGQWYLEMIMRDNTGSDDTEKTQFNCLGTTKYDYSETSWHHLVVVYDGSTNSAPSINFYVDGSSISSSSVGGGINYAYSDLDFQTSGMASVGARYSGWYPFDGDISVVRVYRDKLTSSEIQCNHAIGLIMPDAEGKGSMDVIFDSDVTNLLTCESWYRDGSHLLTPYIIKSSIEELGDTGVDVHMTCPGLGRVPLWPSRVLPEEKHYEWFLAEYGIVPSSQFTDYLFIGGDTLGEMLDCSKENNIGAFVSYRLNDQHNLDAVDDDPISGNAAGTICQFYYDNPTYRLGTDLTKVDQRVLDWEYDEVRNFVFERIEEICENYDLEGLQLDFLRHGAYFDTSQTTSAQRKSIMTGFVARVRQLVNRTTEPGCHVYLGVRIPAFDDTYDQLGIDIDQMIDAGVDFINFSNNFHTVQQNELTTLLSSVPSYVKTYYEVTNTISWIPPDDPEPRHFRYSTQQMLTTTAHLAYSNGIDGISAFNFQYYRPPTTDDTDGYEPPYNIFEKLSNLLECSADPNQHYVVAEVYDYPTGWVNQLPNSYSQNESLDIDLRMAQPDDGWGGNWRLRIMADSDISGSTWEVKFNGTTLSSNADVSEPYDQSYDPQWDNTNMYKGFTVSIDDFIDGDNTIAVKLTSSTSVNLVYLDLFCDD